MKHEFQSFAWGPWLLVAMSFGALGVARSILAELTRWPGRHGGASTPAAIATRWGGAAVVGLVLVLLVAWVVRAIAPGFRERLVVCAVASTPLIVSLGLAVGLLWPRHGISRGVAGAMGLWGVVVFLLLIRRRRSGRALPGERSLGALGVMTFALEIGVGYAVVIHQPSHIFAHAPGLAVQFEELRPVSWGRADQPADVMRLLPAGVRVRVKASPGPGGFVRVKLENPHADTLATLVVADANAGVRQRIPIAAVRSEDRVLRLERGETELLLWFEGEAPWIAFVGWSVGPHGLVGHPDVVGNGDPPRALVLPAEQAAAWRHVRARGEVRSALLMPVGAEVCVPVRPDRESASTATFGVALVDGLPTGEVRAAIRLEDLAGKTLAESEIALDRVGFLDLSLSYSDATARVCLSAGGDRELGWWVGWSEPLPATRNQARLPNVILISIDTLRADVVGAYGGHARTPALDEIARTGVVFEQASSSAAWTLPAHVSLLTSQLPSRHGMWGSFANVSTRRLAHEIPTLAERLRDRGYVTLAATGGAFVSSSWGLARGFDRFIEADREGVLRDAKDRDAVLAASLRLGDVGTAPFFLFVHTYSVHHPYGGADLPSESSYRASAELAFSAYLAGVEYTDFLVAELRRHLPGSETLWFVTSDHGEEFAEHHPKLFVNGHGHSVYEEVIHVPLVVAGPGIPAGLRVADPVSLCDVAPTILSLTGSVALAGDGIDLGWAFGRRPGPERVVIAERGTGSPNEFKAARIGKQKLIRDFSESGLASWYDLGQDPRERQPLAASPSVWQSRLTFALEGLAPEPPAPGAGQLDAHAIEQLRALGYVQ